MAWVYLDIYQEVKFKNSSPDLLSPIFFQQLIYCILFLGHPVSSNVVFLVLSLLPVMVKNVVFFLRFHLFLGGRSKDTCKNIHSYCYKYSLVQICNLFQILKRKS